MDLDSSFSFQLYSCLFGPSPMQFVEVFFGWGWRIISSGVFERCKLLISESFKESNLIGFLKNVEIEEFKFDSIVFLSSDNFAFFVVPVFDFLFSEMVPQ